ncbi:MAG TPA: M56 family metallopeptidase [Terriglobales bacterium]|nr:M56 family metallopeptidase [Terriglobales bacterium]
MAINMAIDLATPSALLVLKVSTVLAVILLAASICRSAAARHRLLVVGFAAVLLLPLLAVVLPAWNLHWLPPQAAASIQPATLAPVTATEAQRLLPPHARESLPTTPLERVSSASLATPAGVTLPLTQPSQGAPNWSVAFLLLWLLGTLLLAGRAILHRIQLQALYQRGLPAGEEWASKLDAARPNAGKEIALRLSPEIEVPIALSRRSPAILLPSEAETWTADRCQAALRHEVAHIDRHDGLSLALADAALAAYWFHPLLWIAVRSARANCERACDDRVLAGGMPAWVYAGELLGIVATLTEMPPAGALAMAWPRRVPGRIEERVLCLLDAKRRRRPLSRRATLAVIGLATALVIPLAAVQAAAAAVPPAKTVPAIDSPVPTAASLDRSPLPLPVPPAPVSALPAQQQPCRGGNRSMNVSGNQHGGTLSYSASWSGGNCDIEVRSEGNVSLNADATAISGLDPDGYFEVHLRRDGERRDLRITPSATGLQYNYKVGGVSKPYDAAAQAWFADFLLEFERSTGFAADQREKVLWRQGGARAVLAEMSNLDGDYVRGLYFKKLLAEPDLTSDSAVMALERAGTLIGGDYELAQVLTAAAARFPSGSEALRTAYLGAAEHIHGDYEHGRVLIVLLSQPNLNRGELDQVVSSTASIHGDYERSQVLQHVVTQPAFATGDWSAYLDAVNGMGSDYEKSRDLQALVQRFRLDGDQLTAVLHGAAKLHSDYEKSQIALAVASAGALDSRGIEAYIGLADTVGSDYERGRELAALLEHDHLDDSGLGLYLAAAARIGSDYERSNALRKLAAQYTLTGTVRDQYVRAARTMGDYEQTRALAALVK